MKQTNLFGTVPHCRVAYIQQSKRLTQSVGTAPLARGEASWSRRAGCFGSREDFLAEVSVQNELTAETLDGKTLPATRG